MPTKESPKEEKNSLYLQSNRENKRSYHEINPAIKTEIDQRGSYEKKVSPEKKEKFEGFFENGNEFPPGQIKVEKV